MKAVKPISYWSALDTIRQIAIDSDGTWAGGIDALLALLIGKTRISKAYREYLEAELQTAETARILFKRGVNYCCEAGVIRFALIPPPKPESPFRPTRRNLL